MATADVVTKKQLGNETEDFYDKAKKYWSEIDATDNGVLGGYGWISEIDIRGSNKFLSAVFKGQDVPDKTRALDCGAGIGRVSSQLLFHHFNEVDLVEQNALFLEEAKRKLVGDSRLGKLYACSLRTFEPEEKYDVIWCQWVLSHLTDNDLCQFLKRCRQALRPRGIIIIKENVSTDGNIEDEVDSSVTRTARNFLEIFRNADLRVIQQAKQTNFPPGLFGVKIYALR